MDSLRVPNETARDLVTVRIFLEPLLLPTSANDATNVQAALTDPTLQEKLLTLLPIPIPTPTVAIFHAAIPNQFNSLILIAC